MHSSIITSVSKKSVNPVLFPVLSFLRGCLKSPDRVFQSAKAQETRIDDDGLAALIQARATPQLRSALPERRAEGLFKHSLSDIPVLAPAPKQAKWATAISKSTCNKGSKPGAILFESPQRPRSLGCARCTSARSVAVGAHYISSTFRDFVTPTPLILVLAVLFLLCFSTIGCGASIPQQKYGVSSVDIVGEETFNHESILVCLATHKRPRFTLNIGRDPTPVCDQPPFDSDYAPLNFWIWPWTDWPIYDETVLDRDLDRIERWYKARGYYDALVVDFEIIKDEEKREVEIEITVDPGVPIIIKDIEVQGIEDLPFPLRRSVLEAARLHVGERFDEADYDKSKAAIRSVLGEASFAAAVVQGKVVVDPVQRKSYITFIIEKGPSCHFDNVIVEGNRDLSTATIIDAAAIETGAVYSEYKLKDAREAIYDLGAFASVEVSPKIRPDDSEVDVLVRVVPARNLRFAVGVGIESNMRTKQTGSSNEPGVNISQWDVHLLFRVEHRNFLGGLRRLSIEDRPRMIFNQKFPSIPDKPKEGNLLMVELRQPAFLESRTMLITASEWDYGPDPYGGTFFRHDLDTWIGPGRYFFQHKLYLSSTIHYNLFFPVGAPTCSEWLRDYYVTFLQHTARLDLRNDRRSPRRGTYYAVTIQHAGYFLPSNWDYIRLTPEVRGYLPLPLRLVLAARVRFGVLIITGNTFSDDPEFAELRDYGPIRYRLRGGGPNSVRGYDSNTLGDTSKEQGCLYSGGLRQWEASLELRIPLTVDFGTVLFIDVGDVTVDEVFRFYYPHTTIGFGFRINTIVGPLRFDLGLLPRDLQYFGDFTPPQSDQKSKVFGLDGAVHITIGEAF